MLVVAYSRDIFIYNKKDPNNLILLAYYDFDEQIFFGNVTYTNNYFVLAGSDRYHTNTRIFVFEFPCSTCSGNCELDLKPDNLDIDVYPNPFNSSIGIKTASAEQVEIYNLLGDKIEHFNCKDLDKTFYWSPDRGVPSGCYLVAARRKDELLVKKVLFIG